MRKQTWKISDEFVEPLISPPDKLRDKEQQYQRKSGPAANTNTTIERIFSQLFTCCELGLLGTHFHVKKIGGLVRQSYIIVSKVGRNPSFGLVLRKPNVSDELKRSAWVRQAGRMVVKSMFLLAIPHCGPHPTDRVGEKGNKWIPLSRRNTFRIARSTTSDDGPVQIDSIQIYTIHYCFNVFNQPIRTRVNRILVWMRVLSVSWNLLFNMMVYIIFDREAKRKGVEKTS